MKYDSSIVGEKVIDESGREGTIINVGKDGAIKVRFTGDEFCGEYRFDPFLSEHIKFVNSELQKPIDDEIAKERQKTVDIVNASIAKKRDKQTFHITKDNDDGTKEVVYRLKCDRNQAYTIFCFAITEQQKEYRASGFTIKWRVIRLFDSQTGEQIHQES